MRFSELCALTIALILPLQYFLLRSFVTRGLGGMDPQPPKTVIYSLKEVKSGFYSLNLHPLVRPLEQYC